MMWFDYVGDHILIEGILEVKNLIFKFMLIKQWST